MDVLWALDRRTFDIRWTHTSSLNASMSHTVSCASLRVRKIREMWREMAQEERDRYIPTPAQVCLQAKREHVQRICLTNGSSQGQNLALTVLNVPSSLEKMDTMGEIWREMAQEERDRYIPTPAQVRGCENVRVGWCEEVRV